jgi:late competence protein required for DNA uptake (superfamily II DNA/RNA helicase)
MNKRQKKKLMFGDEEYMRNMIKKRIIKFDGEPLKCMKCGCRKFTLETGLECREMYCKSCETIVGYWEYGYWMLLS